MSKQQQQQAATATVNSGTTNNNQTTSNHQQIPQQQGVSSSDIYMSCLQLQNWLQENWLIGSLIIKMIVQKQMDEFKLLQDKVGITDSLNHSQMGLIQQIYQQRQNASNGSIASCIPNSGVASTHNLLSALLNQKQQPQKQREPTGQSELGQNAIGPGGKVNQDKKDSLNDQLQQLMSQNGPPMRAAASGIDATPSN